MEGVYRCSKRYATLIHACNDSLPTVIALKKSMLRSILKKIFDTIYSCRIPTPHNFEQDWLMTMGVINVQVKIFSELTDVLNILK